MVDDLRKTVGVRTSGGTSKGFSRFGPPHSLVFRGTEYSMVHSCL